MSLTEKLNIYLANQQVMFIKLHNLHWYVKGKSFFTLHGKFEELYDVTADIIDEVAERLLAKNESPVASLKEALNLTGVVELDSKPISSQHAVNILIADFEYWINDTKEIIELSEEEGDVVTADIFTGYLNNYEKTMWMLKSYVEEV